ncbi:MAG: hypothetical protein C0594_18120 [Marinilabiliales bacterium]|nr:MAG: hypothetical protein C0594_18120 [Marinilabiliales bacterium]
MNIKISPDSIDYNILKQKLEEKFSNYKLKERSKNFLVLRKNNTCGTNVLLKKKKVIVAGNFPTTGGQIIFMLSILILGFIIPLIIYFVAFHGKMKKMEKEIAVFIKEEFKDSVISK